MGYASEKNRVTSKYRHEQVSTKLYRTRKLTGWFHLKNTVWVIIVHKPPPKYRASSKEWALNSPTVGMGESPLSSIFVLPHNRAHIVVCVRLERTPVYNQSPMCICKRIVSVHFSLSAFPEIMNLQVHGVADNRIFSRSRTRITVCVASIGM